MLENSSIEPTRIHPPVQTKTPQIKVENIYCKICSKLPITPRICTNCAEILCSLCSGKICPICQGTQFANIPRVLREKYEELKIICIHEGCQNMYYYSDILMHQKLCKYEEENMNISQEILEERERQGEWDEGDIDLWVRKSHRNNIERERISEEIEQSKLEVESEKKQLEKSKEMLIQVQKRNQELLVTLNALKEGKDVKLPTRRASFRPPDKKKFVKKTLHSDFIKGKSRTFSEPVEKKEEPILLSERGEEDNIYIGMQSIQSIIPYTRVLFSDGYGKLLCSKGGEEPEIIFESETGTIYDIKKFSDDLYLLATAGKVVYIFDLKEKKVKTTCKGHKGYVNAVEKLNSGVIVSGGSDQRIIFWNIYTGEPIYNIKGHQDFVTSLAKLPAKGKFASAGLDKQLIIWNTSKFVPEKEYIYTNQAEIYSIVVFESETIILGNIDGNIIFYNWVKSEVERVLDGVGQRSTCMGKCMIVIEGKLWFSGGPETHLKCFDLKVGGYKTGTGHAKTIRGICCYNSDAIVTVSDDKSLRFWNANSLNSFVVLKHESYLYAVIAIP